MKRGNESGVASVEDVLRIERIDTVIRLTFNRPRAANALNEALQLALACALRDAAADPSVRAAILDGAGGKIFSAGADLKEFSDLPDAQARSRRRDLLRHTLFALLDFNKPLLACVHGKAIGGGCMLALLADEVHAAKDAQFSLPEVRLGMPTPAGAVIAAARGGRRAAQLLALSAEPLGADAALALQLIDRVHESPLLSAACVERALCLGALDPGAYAHSKQWINAGLRSGIALAMDESARLQASMSA